MSDETETEKQADEAEVSAANEPEPTPGKLRNRWRFVDGVAIVRRPDGTETPYALASLPNMAIERLAYEGLVGRMSKADDEGAAYAEIASCKFLEKAPTKPKPVNHWRTAIAMARVDAKKKTAEPVTLEEAKAWSLSLDAALVRQYKLDSKVAAHFRKLSGVELPSLAD